MRSGYVTYDVYITAQTWRTFHFSFSLLRLGLPSHSFFYFLYSYEAVLRLLFSWKTSKRRKKILNQNSLIPVINEYVEQSYIFLTSEVVGCKKGVLNSCAKIHRKTPCATVFFKEVADCRPATLLTKVSHSVHPVCRFKGGRWGLAKKRGWCFCREGWYSNAHYGSCEFLKIVKNTYFEENRIWESGLAG